MDSSVLTEAAADGSPRPKFAVPLKAEAKYAKRPRFAPLSRRLTNRDGSPTKAEAEAQPYQSPKLRLRRRVCARLLFQELRELYHGDEQKDGSQ